MFKKNKRRDESTFLSMENGEVVTKKEDKKINARNCDEFSDEEIEEISKDIDIEIKNGLPVCEPIQNDSLDDNVLNDMKVTIFNILKFIFTFCIIAIIGFLVIKVSPTIIEKVKESKNIEKSSINTTQKVDDSNNFNFIQKQKSEKEKKKLIETMNNMNSINNQLKEDWNLLQSYCVGYSNNTYTIYNHNKNIAALETQFSTEYLNFLNTQDSYKTDCDKELFELYKNRYENLTNSITMLKDTDNYNRSTIIEKLNEYITIDNGYNEDEFNILIENFNNYNLNYTITDNEIILNK